MASAQVWMGGAGPNEPYWDVVSNWDTLAIPTESDTANIGPVADLNEGESPWACVIDDLTGNAVCNHLYVGTDDGKGILNMTGGTLTVGTYLRIGANAGTEGVLNLSGGEIICLAKEPEIARNGYGILNMTGGTITAATGRNFWLGSISNPANFGLLNMDGGTITTPGYFSTRGNGHLRMAGGEINCGGQVKLNDGSAISVQYDLYGGTITGASLGINTGNNVDVSGAKLILNSSANLTDYINDGRLTAWGGLGTVVITDVNTAGVMTYEVTGTADSDIMARAWKPSPATGANVTDEQVTLQWVAGQGAKVHNVYFGTDPEALELLPNDIEDPNEGIIQGVLSVDFSYDVNGLGVGNTYYWRVDEVNESDVVTTGNLWSFLTKPLELATVVFPLDGATEVNTVDLTLEWLPGLGAVNEDVYFGTDAANLDLVSEDQTEANYLVPGSLIPGMTYYWRVDSFDGTDVWTGLTTSFTTIAPAGVSNFTNDAPEDSLWRNPANWSDGLPGVGTEARLRDTAGAIVVVDANTNAYCSTLQFGWNSGNVADMDITGGSLTLLGGMEIGRFAGSMATIYMFDGVFNLDFIRGWHGDIFIQMTGGEMNIAGTLEIPRSYTSTEGASGILKLVDGVVRAGDITLNSNENVVSLVDVNEGTFILDGDKVSKVNGYIEAGLIKAYGGEGSIVVGFDAETNKTTVRACPEKLNYDFNADCVVDALDREILLSDMGYVTPTATVWDFDMSTDPVGTDPLDLNVRNANSGNYAMDELSGTLEVAGALLLDRNLQVPATFDTDLHFIAKCQSGSDAPLNYWLTQGTSTTPGMRAYVGFSLYRDGDTQTLELWVGNPPHVDPYEPIVAAGFAPNTMIDISVSYDFDTDTFDWTATDGTLSLSGSDVPYTAHSAGDGGSFTIQGVDGTDATIDYYGYTIHGQGANSPYDLNDDGTVDQLDLDLFDAEMAAQ